MNVETITMEPKLAAAKLDAYRRRLDRSSDPVLRAEYEGALAGYKALAKGTPVISLRQSIDGAGLDAELRPILAVMRADAKTVSCCRCPGEIRFYHPNLGRGRSGWGRSFTFAAPGIRGYLGTLHAVVPMIPADVGPKRIDLKRHLILWEAHWTEVPVDPMLLKPLAGDLYAVVAAWDLTPIERLVIAGRLRQ